MELFTLYKELLIQMFLHTLTLIPLYFHNFLFTYSIINSSLILLILFLILKQFNSFLWYYYVSFQTAVPKEKQQMFHT